MTEPSESKIHTEVADWLRAVERDLGEPMIWTSVVNEGRRGYRTQQMIKRHGLRKGWPDLTILHGGDLLTIELKSARGRLSPEQRVVAEIIKKAGGYWACCRSLEEVQQWLKDQGRVWPLLPHQRLGLRSQRDNT